MGKIGPFVGIGPLVGIGLFGRTGPVVSLTYIKVGSKGVYITRICLHDDTIRVVP